MVENARPVLFREFLICNVMLVAAASLSVAETQPIEGGPQPLSIWRDFHLPDAQLAGLLAVLLRDNPEIQEARELSYSSLERMPQERSLPDPEFSYQLFVETPETRVGPQEHQFEISQGLPWFGKRELQGIRAGHTATGESWRVRDLERALVARLKRAYFDAAYVQEALAINADEALLLRRFEQIALTRYSTGEGIQQSVIKVQTDIGRLVDRRIALQEQLDSIESRIVHLLGGRNESELVLQPIHLNLPRLGYSRAALELDALESNPAVRATQQRIEADEAWIRRRHRDSFPDFSLGLLYTDVGKREDAAGMVSRPEEDGKDIWALSVKVNIPLYRGRIRAGVAEAEYSLRAGQQHLRRTRHELMHGVRESLQRFESTGERARLYRDLLIRQAEESLASAEAAYTTGRQSFLDLLDAERVLFQVRLTYYRLLSDYWIALADLERTVARPLPGNPPVEPTTDEEGRP